ncbi:hypothetical protein VPH35_044673 [Triticum aestivum]
MGLVFPLLWPPRTGNQGCQGRLHGFFRQVPTPADFGTRQVPLKDVPLHPMWISTSTTMLGSLRYVKVDYTTGRRTPSTSPKTNVYHYVRRHRIRQVRRPKYHDAKYQDDEDRQVRLPPSSKSSSTAMRCATTSTTKREQLLPLPSPWTTTSSTSSTNPNRSENAPGSLQVTMSPCI